VILVIVGTNFYSFDRLIKAVDLCIQTSHSKVIQIGASKYIPVNSNYFDYKDNETIGHLIEECELVITHGGFGTMMEAIELGKRTIAVPRKLEFGECLDNQEELVKYFESKNYVVGCYEIKDLPNLVDQCLMGKISFANYKPESSLKISDLIEQNLKIYFNYE
jgi:UDP-N-acetylglucosamine transferase subunit ALG13